MYKWIILLVIVCAICVAEWMREIHTFKMTHYDLEAKKLQGLKNKKIILRELIICKLKVREK